MMRQPSLFDPPKPEKDRTEAIERLRHHVRSLLHIVRTAEVMPWTPVNLGFKIKDFELYSAELPEEERDELRAKFSAELKRLSEDSDEQAA